DPSGRFGMVTVRAIKSMTQPVTLADIKAEPRLSELALVKQSRLSVVPVGEAEWNLILEMGKTSL
ncbi:MAG: EVE domain-containing protein, partial [Candidatus Puniceispirillaceae bacterium]